MTKRKSRVSKTQRRVRSERTKRSERVGRKVRRGKRSRKNRSRSQRNSREKNVRKLEGGSTWEEARKNDKMGMLLDQNAPTTNPNARDFGQLGSCVSPKATSAGGVHSGRHLYVTKVIGNKLESSTFEEAKKRLRRKPYRPTVTLDATDYIEWAAAYDYFYDVARYHETSRLEPTERHKHCKIAIPGGWDAIDPGDDDVPPWSPPGGWDKYSVQSLALPGQ